MSAFTTVNPATAANGTAPGGQQPSHSPPVAQAENPAPELDDDGESVLSDPPPHDELLPVPMQIDGIHDHRDHNDHFDHTGQLGDQNGEENPKKRKRYNDPPNEVHAELRRPQVPGKWYSKTPEQWEELSHLHKLIYSHVGRIEETDLGEEVEPCEACKKRGFQCMKYKQDHPEVEKLYKGNVRVGTSCTRCRRYRRTCAPPNSMPRKPNGHAQAAYRPMTATNGYGGASGHHMGPGLPAGDTLDNWENTLLAAASGGSPLTSVASSPIEYAEPPPAALPPPAHPQPHHVPHRPSREYAAPFEHDEVNNAVAKLSFLNRVQALESELTELRAAHADFNRERRDWQAEKRDMQGEIYFLRETERKVREENLTLHNRITQLEHGSSKAPDMERLMAEAELKVENRQLVARVDLLVAQRQTQKAKMKEMKHEMRQLQRKLAELEPDAAGDEEMDYDESESTNPTISAKGTAEGTSSLTNRESSPTDAKPSNLV